MRTRFRGPRLSPKRRGRPSNRKLAADVRARVLALVKERYADFGPTLACEKLREQHDVVVSVETLRTWMSSEGLWRTRMQRRKPAQSPRRRRSCLGELVQIDGSDHEWFEGRAPRCTLLVYVDDATSRLMELRFVRSESTFEYFAATERYVRAHGKPCAFTATRPASFASMPRMHARATATRNLDALCTS
ncbi:MAG: helix-turn-helix domain-containing protein [Sandaracinaceae bacterium]|nr:helix-turn-helix domain-containing protein [Sandaracinaceae bacterium]